VRNIALYVSLRATAWLMRLVPLRVMYALAAAAGTLAYYVVPSARNGILSNLAVALPDLTSRHRSTIGRCAFCSDAKNWVDTLRISRLTDHEICRDIHVEGLECLEAAAAEGRGVVLVTMHLGNFDLVGQYIAARGYRLTIPVEKMRPPQLFDYLVRLRASRGINIIPVQRAPLQMLRALRKGGVAGLAGDRDFTGGGICVDFFGRPALMPSGPARLARHQRAPLLIGVGVRRASGGYQGYIPERLDLQFTDDDEADDLENTRRIARALEPFVCRFPEQWLAFSPIWGQGTDSDGLATIGRQERAAV
jgi:KDO2-lipid IV(A) lauroyltransferase